MATPETYKHDEKKEEIELDEVAGSPAFDFDRFESYSKEDSALLSKKLVRKLDFTVLPLLVLLFIVSVDACLRGTLIHSSSTSLIGTMWPTPRLRG
jgi:hypothetical protein